MRRDTSRGEPADVVDHVIALAAEGSELDKRIADLVAMFVNVERGKSFEILTEDKKGCTRRVKLDAGDRRVRDLVDAAILIEIDRLREESTLVEISAVIREHSEKFREELTHDIEMGAARKIFAAARNQRCLASQLGKAEGQAEAARGMIARSDARQMNHEIQEERDAREARTGAPRKS